MIECVWRAGVPPWLRVGQPTRRLRQLSVVGVVVLWLAGCTSNQPYHQCGADADAARCADSYLQPAEHYSLAIPEFSERGNAFDDQVIDDVLQLVRGGPAVSTTRDSEHGVVTIVYVHGWKHNGSEREGGNLADFKKVLAGIGVNAEGSNLNDRRLVGVYVGWRGLSVDLPGIRELSYWERKSVAEQLGNTGLSRLLLELDVIDRERPDNVLVIVGHSFGGAAVLSAIAKPLLARMTEDPVPSADARDPCADVRCGVGDGVFLLNPAIEANQALSLVEASLKLDFSDQQPPLLVSLSSEADWANAYAFPLGQTLGLIATSKQTELERQTFVVDGDNGPVPEPVREESLDTITVGNFAPYLSHRIDVPPSEEVCRGVEHAVASIDYEFDTDPLQRCDDYHSSEACGPKRFPSGFDRTTKGLRVAGRGLNNPLYFVRTNTYFMSGHNDIFNPHVIAFLSAQLDERLFASGHIGHRSNRLFSDASAFTQQYKNALGFSCSIDF
ncbi:MAG: hypothetical protein AAF460_01280 [Pseudomonadota bacterium]